VTGDLVQQAQEHFDAERYREARESALGGLQGRPGDVTLLRIAGRAGVEIDSDDAVELLTKVTELAPDDATSWRDLGDALATEGRTDESNDAFAKAVELDPQDETSLTALGHTAFAAGRSDEAVELLEQAAERGGRNSSALISLVDMHRLMGRYDEALTHAERIAEAAPDDVVAALDVAELLSESGRRDESLVAFGRLRDLVDLPEHEVCVLHGMVGVEMARDDTAGALDHAREAAAIDQHGRTRQLLAYLEAKEGKPIEEGEFVPPPSEGDVADAIASSLLELRRYHVEARGGSLG
jgi:tetratricopeptide (TPR) repeat protein